MIRVLFVPVLAGSFAAVIFNTIPVEYILMAGLAGLIIFMFFMLYKWILEDIKAQDKLNAMSNKE